MAKKNIGMDLTKTYSRTICAQLTLWLLLNVEFFETYLEFKPLMPGGDKRLHILKQTHMCDLFVTTKH